VTIPGDRFVARFDEDVNRSVLQFSISEGSQRLTYSQVLDYWETDDEFTHFYISLFERSGLKSYLWETPPITQASRNRDFEFVLLATPVSSRQPDRERYRDYYESDNADSGVVVFDNLGGDTKLVVPSPLRPKADYSNLAAFFAEAPLEQQRALWRVVARTARARLGDQPIWISVAGGGIAWLHVRIDPRPKYYRHAPYRTHV
jgi:hypothetical protein